MAAQADTIDTAELKRLLIRSKREPINCAVGMRKNEPIIQLHPIKQGRAILKELEKQYSDLKMQRWGTAFVDADADPKLVILTLNKEAPGLARQLKPTLKSVGFNKVEIRREDGSVAESESDEPAHLRARAEAERDAGEGISSYTPVPEELEEQAESKTSHEQPSYSEENDAPLSKDYGIEIEPEEPLGQTAGTDAQSSTAAERDPSYQKMVSEEEKNDADARRRDAAAEEALVAEEEGVSGAPPERQGQEPEPEIDVREQTKRLASLIKQMGTPLQADPEQLAALKALAVKAGSALKEGREDAVSLIDKVEKRLKDAAAKALQNDPVPPIDPGELSQQLAELVRRIMPVMAADSDIGRQLKDMAVEAKNAIRDHDPVAAALVDQLDASIRGAEKIADAAQAVAEKAEAAEQQAEEDTRKAANEAVEQARKMAEAAETQVSETVGKDAKAAAEWAEQAEEAAAQKAQEEYDAAADQAREAVEAVKKQVEPQIDGVIETVTETAKGIGKEAEAEAQWAQQAEQAAAQKAQQEYDAAAKQAQEAANAAQQAAQPYLDEGSKAVEEAAEAAKSTASGLFDSVSEAVSGGAAIE